MDFLNENKISQTNIFVVGCDGTNVNTGVHKGIIRLWEQHLQRPLQRFICQLHANELPLRHLLNHLDGITSGPKSLTGLIGKMLPGCEDLQLVNFRPIDSHLPITFNGRLSCDQKYLFDICQSIKSGLCSERLAKRSPGKMVHSRWITTANRILRLYVSTSSPSDSLLQLVDFIVKV